MSERNHEIERLVESLQESQISRRQFVTRAACLGLSLPVIGGLLAANGTAATRRTAQAAAAAAVVAQAGGTLREGYDLDFSRMDPINTSWYDPGFFALYEAAITLDPKARFVKQLATGWSTKNNGKTWTLKIRKGAKFHSGAPLTAAAVADVLSANTDPKS